MASITRCEDERGAEPAPRRRRPSNERSRVSSAERGRRVSRARPIRAADGERTWGACGLCEAATRRSPDARQSRIGRRRATGWRRGWVRVPPPTAPWLRPLHSLAAVNDVADATNLNGLLPQILRAAAVRPPRPRRLLRRADRVQAVGALPRRVPHVPQGADARPGDGRRVPGVDVLVPRAAAAALGARRGGGLPAGRAARRARPRRDAARAAAALLVLLGRADAADAGDDRGGLRRAPGAHGDPLPHAAGARVRARHRLHGGGGRRRRGDVVAARPADARGRRAARLALRRLARLDVRRRARRARAAVAARARAGRRRAAHRAIVRALRRAAVFAAGGDAADARALARRGAARRAGRGGGRRRTPTAAPPTAPPTAAAPSRRPTARRPARPPTAAAAASAAAWRAR